MKHQRRKGRSGRTGIVGAVVHPEGLPTEPAGGPPCAVGAVPKIRAETPKALHPDEGRRVLLLCAILAALVAVAFYPVVHNDLINLDDPSYVALNNHIQHGLNWTSVKWAFTSFDAANWHPLTWISHIIDYQIFGERVWGHHLTSLILHALNTLFLFVVLRSMTGSVWRSFFVAALFGLHPLRVESVAWVAERKDVLSTFFFLGTLFAFNQYARSRRAPVSEEEAPSPEGPWSRPAWAWYALTVIGFALGLMSKPMVVTLPFVLLLLDIWPLQRASLRHLAADLQRNGGLVMEKVPLFLLAVVSSSLTMMAQRAGGVVVATGGTALATRAENAVLSYCRYLAKFFWPIDLAVFYPMPEHLSSGAVLAGAFLLLGVSGLAVWVLRRAPYVPVGWFWFIGTLVPVIGLIQVGWQAMADRYTYLPSIGISLLVVWALAGMREPSWPLARDRGLLLSIGGSALILSCVFLTRRQVSYWRDSETLLRHSLKVTEDNAFVHDTLGLALRLQGRLDESNAEFRQAIRLNTNYAGAYRDLGYNLIQQRKFREGIPLLQTAARLVPQLPRTHKELGVAFQEEGQLNAALAEFEQELKFSPADPEAHHFRGGVLLGLGRTAEAKTEFHRAIELKPDYAEPHSNLGIALCREGQLPQGIAQFEDAIKINPDYAEAHNNLAVALARAGRRAEAITHLKEALRLRPNYPGAAQQLQALGAGQ